MSENKIISSIYQKIEAQQAKGLKKYGKEVHTDSHSLREWLQHALEETLDKAVYLEAAIQKIDEQEKILQDQYEVYITLKNEALRQNNEEAVKLNAFRASAVWDAAKNMGFTLKEFDGSLS